MKIVDKEALRERLEHDGFDAYVFFAFGSAETELCAELNNKYEDIYCLVLKRMMHRSDHGRKWDEEDVLIKGYVFVYVEKGFDIKTIKSDNNPYKVLNRKMDDGKLFGGDLDYAEWAFMQKGLIGVSKAIKLNEKVKIVSGPLQELEGYIVEYSRRNRNCCVEIHFMNQTIKTWLPFEWTDQNYIMDSKDEVSDDEDTEIK